MAESPLTTEDGDTMTFETVGSVASQTMVVFEDHISRDEFLTQT